MLDPVPGSPSIDAAANGSWIGLLITGIVTLIGGWLPFHYGRKGVKPATPPELAATVQSPVPQAKPGSPPADATGKTVVVDLPSGPVTVVVGSPEWSIVLMVNQLERRVDSAEKRAEAAERRAVAAEKKADEQEHEAQRRFDLLNDRWQEKYDRLDQKYQDQQVEMFDKRAEVRALTVQVDALEAEVHTLQGQLMGRPPQ